MDALKQEPELKLPFRILVIVAHHDDIEFGVAGSVARWTDQGADVTYCIVTDGGAGSNDPNVNLAELVERRKDEQRRAAEIVGVRDVRFLGYRDGVLQPSLELRRDLTRLIREVKPNRVVIQDPSVMYYGDYYINHPDHRAAGEAATYAVFPSAETRPIFPELLDEGYEPHQVSELYLGFSMQPNVFVDITDSIDRKLAALLCHASQVGDEVREWVHKWGSEEGQRFGVAYAESFHAMYLDLDRQQQTAQAEGQAEAVAAEAR